MRCSFRAHCNAPPPDPCYPYPLIPNPNPPLLIFMFAAVHHIKVLIRYCTLVHMRGPNGPLCGITLYPRKKDRITTPPAFHS